MANLFMDPIFHRIQYKNVRLFRERAIQVSAAMKLAVTKV